MIFPELGLTKSPQNFSATMKASFIRFCRSTRVKLGVLLTTVTAGDDDDNNNDIIDDSK